jgi:hypothetical protein
VSQRENYSLETDGSDSILDIGKPTHNSDEAKQRTRGNSGAEASILGVPANDVKMIREHKE